MVQPGGGGGYNFLCQHGPQECAGNIAIACARDAAKNIEQYLTFVNCIMREFVGGEAAEKVLE